MGLTRSQLAALKEELHKKSVYFSIRHKAPGEKSPEALAVILRSSKVGKIRTGPRLNTLK